MVDPFAYLAATLQAIPAGHPPSRIDDFTPWACAAASGGVQGWQLPLAMHGPLTATLPTDLCRRDAMRTQFASWGVPRQKTALRFRSDPATGAPSANGKSVESGA